MKAGRVYLKHLRKLRYCSRGSREFFKRHGFDWHDFLRNGIDAQKFIDTGDAMALRAVAEANGGR